MATAKHRAIDQLRRRKLMERKHEELGREVELEGEGAAPDLDAALDDDIGDDLLRLIFTACHPVLATDARVALTLRLLGGLTTEEIARAFLVPEPTVAQRIVRAKRTLAEKRVPFEIPREADRVARLSSVLEVIYLIFNEGYSATAGDDWIRPHSARKPFGSAVFWPVSPRWSPRCTDSLRSWKSRLRVLARASVHRENRSCCLIKAVRGGTSYSFAAGWRRSSGPRRAAGSLGRAWTLHAPGRDCRLPCTRSHRGRHGLEAHRGSLRATGASHAVAGRASSIGPLPSRLLWAQPRLGDRRCAGIGASVEDLSSLAKRSRRSAQEARPVRRSSRRVRAGSGADAKRARARSAARASGRVRFQAGVTHPTSRKSGRNGPNDQPGGRALFLTAEAESKRSLTADY